MICRDANNLTEENDVVAAIMLGVRSAFESRCAAGKNWRASFARLEFDPFKFVDIPSGKMPRKLRLILSQDMNTEVTGCLKGADTA